MFIFTTVMERTRAALDLYLASEAKFNSEAVEIIG